MRVVVVGAGLGGLSVANGLCRAGIPVEVLEAQDRIREDGQGYRINVNPAGHEALRACLPPGAFASYQRTLHRQADPAVSLYSPALDLIARHEAPAAPGALDRGTVRRLLADGVADRIRFGRRVTSLADAGPADLVVAADGVHSALRRELLPGAEPHPLGMSAIFGRAPLTPSNRVRTAPAILHGRFCGLVEADSVLALCAYDPPSAGPAPYVMWVLIAPTDALPPRGAPPAELIRHTRRRTAGWDPRAVWPLREAVAADSFLTPLRAMPEVPALPARAGTPVAFLGDAVHAMSPAAGEGANTALGDAASLVTHLRGAASVTDAVTAYHAEMRVRAGAALRRSATYPAPEVSRAR